jgi:transcriptional regulator with XRE-family HTH domain
MAFKDNLKAELAYKGMLVKELSAITGINKHTLDNYLNVNQYMPSADNAVLIARALGVTVEYLITGEVQYIRDEYDTVLATLPPDVRTMIKTYRELDAENRDTVLHLAQHLQERQKHE